MKFLLFEECQNITKLKPYLYTSNGENCLLVTEAQFSSLKMPRLVAVLKMKHEAQPSDCCSRCVVHSCRFPLENLFLGEFRCLNLWISSLAIIYIDAVNHGVIESLET